MTSSELFTSLLEEQDIVSLSTTVGQETLGEAVVEANDSLIPAVGHCKSTVSGEAAAGSGHDITLPSNSTDIQTLSQALLMVKNSLSGVIQEVKDMKVRTEEKRRGGGVAAAVPLSLSPQTNAHSDAPQTNAHRDALDKRSQSHPEDQSPVDSATAGR
ncbi:hypothetical protein ElyMa_006567800 [Elysia marginata]|uniref:Uncharacterized protein n=1 Tax=Elysia marginata TaxID=1093978 RepID=A0AAV4IFP9_9GAST|nr:hypothetical protein ElyMa_006567800 [Elysia marginata]